MNMPEEILESFLLDSSYFPIKFFQMLYEPLCFLFIEYSCNFFKCSSYTWVDIFWKDFYYLLNLIFCFLTVFLFKNIYIFKDLEQPYINAVADICLLYVSFASLN